MADVKKYNVKNPGVKRILQEAKEIVNDASPELFAAPLEDDLFQWHFTIRVPHPDFQGGVYHGRILLPNEYPLRPPEVLLLTPNGRFEVNKKICLTITGFHEESWQPAWGIRTALTGLTSFFETESKGAIGHMDTPSDERKRMAKISRSWTCPTCKKSNLDILPDSALKLPTSDESSGFVALSETVPSSVPPLPTGTGDVYISTPPPAGPIDLQVQSTESRIASVAFDPEPQGDLPSSVAPVMVQSPPTWTDRFLVILLLCFAGLAARGLS